MRGLIPSYKGGFARYAAESEAPELWRGLVGAWLPFLGPTGLTLRDWSGRHTHGTLIAMAPDDWVVDGEGYALDFLTDDSVVMGQALSGYPFSLTAWVCWDDVNEDTVVSVSAGSNAYYHAIMGLNSFIARTYSSGGGVDDADYNVIPTAGQWYFLVGVWASASSRKIYVDGGFKAEHTGTASAVGTAVTKIGVTADSTPFGYLNGRVSSVCAYNRILTDAEIAWLYRDPHAMWRIAYAPWGITLGVTHYQTPSDSLTLSDSAVKNIVLAKTEALPFTDAVAKSIGLAPSDALSITDVTAKLFGSAPSDLLGLSEAVVKQLNLSISDTEALADSVFKRFDLSKADSIALADAVVKSIGVTRADILSLADSVAKAFGMNVSESLGLADAATRVIAGMILQAVFDQLDLSDSVVKVLIHGAAHKARKDYKDRVAEDIEWHEIIEIERKEGEE